MKTEKKDINGIILIDKPRGMSSNAVVNKVKWLLNAKKAGHLGTLDVEGHGLLPITMGKSTKLFDYFLNKDKVYKAVFRFGIETDTLDLEGEVIHSNNKIVSREEIMSVIPIFVGKQNQMPPQYSAKKINGQKAYDLARKGEKVNLKTKAIEIYDLTLLKQINATDFQFQIHCSSGTYIRSLARDMAYAMSTYGIMPDIIRTRCGKLSLKDAFTIEDVASSKHRIISPENLFEKEKICLNEVDKNKILNGVKISVLQKDGEYKIFSNDEFLGLGRVENGELYFCLRLI